MTHKSSAKDVRLNLIVPLDLKHRLITMALAEGKKVSAFVRESIEEKLIRMERKKFDDKMREAYLEMAEENLDTVEEFKYADSENI